MQTMIFMYCRIQVNIVQATLFSVVVSPKENDQLCNKEYTKTYSIDTINGCNGKNFGVSNSEICNIKTP
jgi:hypothetical protein